VLHLANIGLANRRYNPLEASVELHAHLFMKVGMSWFFEGKFDGPIRAKTWESRFASQANPETVNQSNIGVLVATLYGNRLFSRSTRDSVRAQIRVAEDFVIRNPEWIIARNAKEAKAAFSNGKRIIIFALEGAAGVLETEADLEEFVDRKGIRIVTLLHLIDDRFGAVSFLRGYRVLSAPFAWLRSLWNRKNDASGIRINDGGLTDEGKKMIESLAKRKVWIDLAHSSDRSQIETMKILEEYRQPPLYTHLVLRKYHQAERGTSERQLKILREKNGIVGIMPSEDYLSGTPFGEKCNDGLSQFLRLYQETVKIVGNMNLYFGSDFNGGVPRLGPPKCKTDTELDKGGMVHIGLSNALWKSLKQRGANVPVPLSDTVHRFFEVWSKVTGK